MAYLKGLTRKCEEEACGGDVVVVLFNCRNGPHGPVLSATRPAPARAPAQAEEERDNRRVLEPGALRGLAP